MKYIFLILSLLTYSLLPSQALAGKDPIGWSITPHTGLPSLTMVGSTYAVSYTMTNNLPFSVALSVSASYTGGKFSMVNECNTTLAPNATCMVHLSLQPITARNNKIFLTLAYHRNRVPLPTLFSHSIANQTSNKISGHVTQQLPPNTYMGDSYPVTFTFINNGDTNVTAIAVNIEGFTATTNQCTTLLSAHSQCNVRGTFTPTTNGYTTLGVSYVYSGGSVPLTTSTTVYPSGPTCHLITGEATLPLPSTTFIYANHVSKFTFTNHCASTTQTLGNVTITTDNATSPAPSILQGQINTDNDTCSGKTLNPGQQCDVYASVIPNAIYSANNDLSLQATVNYNNNAYQAQASTSTIVNPLTNQSSLHTLMFVNQCSETVWDGFTNASLDPTTNKTWQGYQLDQQVTGAAPATSVMQFASYTGGTIFGRTLCDTTTNPKTATYGICQTGSCTSLGNATGTCDFGVLSPVTTIEENMLDTTASDGVYDLSLINGFNVSAEFRSLAQLTNTPVNFTNACGQSAGAIMQTTASQLGNCNWIFTPPSTGSDCTAGTATDNASNYYFVPAGSGDGCTPGSCGVGEVCGMSWTPTTPPNPIYQGTPIARHCGPFIGYWTLADWTGYSSSGQWDGCNLFSHYNMGTTLDSIKPSSQPTYGFSQLNPSLSPNLPAAMLADMFACKPTSQTPVYVQPNGSIYVLNSGYDAGVNACGCQDWNNPATTPPNAQTAQASQCKSINPLFTSHVYNRIVWLKEACPTAYSYQFDDPSSQFTCNVTGQRTSYQITFCPGGKSGKP